jgi:F1F0 ATPase subunit 2
MVSMINFPNLDFSAMLSPSLLFSWASVAALVIGMIVGIIYFGGLWLTIRGMTHTQRPALLFIASFVARTAFSIAIIYWMMGRSPDGSVVPLLLCVAGFLVMRTWLVRYWGPTKQAAY